MAAKKRESNQKAGKVPKNLGGIHDRKSQRYPCEISVEVQSSSGSGFYMSVDVSMNGCYVATTKTQPLNQVIQVLLYPPGEDRGIRAMAHVRHVRTELEADDVLPAGMGLEIFAIDTDEKVRWIEYISGVAQAFEEQYGPKQARDRTSSTYGDGGQTAPAAAHGPALRRFVRHRVRMEVQVRDMESMFTLVSRDISGGGIYLETTEKVSLGTSVEVSMIHPISKEALELSGRVVRRDAGGVGVAFSSLSDPRRKELLRFVFSGHTSSKRKIGPG